jgi:predicted aconitase with swiveling domain
VTAGADGRALVDGQGRGRVLRLEEPLSFWGGLDPETGRIIDRRHPQMDEIVTRRVLAMPSGRGSSSSSSVLAEAIRVRSAPSAIVMLEPDEIVALGALVAAELYGVSMPVVVVDPATYGSLREGATVAVDGSRVTVED